MNDFNMVITSSGFNDINNYVSDNMKELYKGIACNKKVMILSNAAPHGNGNYVARENVKENFLKIGANKVDIIDLNKENLSSMLNYDIIYGLGGDPNYLIELNKNPNFKNIFVQFLKKGIYIGESAGSMILCDDLKWAYIIKKGTKPKYDIELDTYQGLGLTDCKIFPHWNKAEENVKLKTEQYEQENNVEFTKLNDGEYIVINYTSDL
jgi:Peptidase E